MDVVVPLQVTEEQHLRNLSSSMNSLQQTLEEAGRLLKLVWRVSLPAGGATAGESGTNQQVDGEAAMRFSSSIHRKHISEEGRVTNRVPPTGRAAETRDPAAEESTDAAGANA